MAQKPSIPKGTRDFSPLEMARRNYIFDTIKSVFSLYGFQQIETPAMENLSTLMGKYGEEGDKLLFKILNSGDWKQSLDAEMLEQAIFEDGGSRMVIVKDIEFYSFCEHHILPFFGTVTIGYIPNGKMVGLSKLARLVDSLARRLQVQERLTNEICRCVYETLGAKGVIVKCTAQHLCMKMRGVEKQDSSTSTIADEGDFSTNAELRRDFFESIKE